MKKITTTLFTILASMSMIVAQPIQDVAIIPVGATLNSIQRLEVTSGHNVEFIVNTFAEYTGGINSAGTNSNYQTTFSVTSSLAYQVRLRADADNFTNVTTGGATLESEFLGLSIDATGGQAGVVSDGTGLSSFDYSVVGTADQVADPSDGADDDVIIEGAVAAAGDVYVINWEFGTAELVAIVGNNLTQETPGRHVLNVVLTLN